MIFQKVKSICLFFGIIHLGCGIIIKNSGTININGSNTPWACLELKHENENIVEIGENMFSCARDSLYVSLFNNMDAECVDMGDGVTFTRNPKEPPTKRENFEHEEPPSLRSLLDAYSNFLSQRSARWDLSFLYPGLVMRIGPTISGSGYIEFGLEKRLDYNDRAKLGPGQMIIRRIILPHLLGFRMNLSSILPLVVGIILIVTKNAFIFSKVTLVLSLLLTLKSLFLVQSFKQPDYDISYDHVNHRPSVMHDPVNFDDEATITTVNSPRPQGYSFSETLSNSILTQIIKRLSANNNSVLKRSTSGKRNFSWEKKKR